MLVRHLLVLPLTACLQGDGVVVVVVAEHGVFGMEGVGECEDEWNEF